MKRMLGEAIGTGDEGGKWCEESQLTSAFLTRNAQGIKVPGAGYLLLTQ